MTVSQPHLELREQLLIFKRPASGLDRLTCMLFSVDAAERECRNLVFADQIRTEGQEEKEKLAEL